MTPGGTALLSVLVLLVSCSEERHEFPTVTKNEVDLYWPRPLTHIEAMPLSSIHVEDEGRSLTVEYESGTGECDALDRIEVKYEPKQIVVTVFEGFLAPIDPNPRDKLEVFCVGVGIEKKVGFALSQPVAGRPVFDGACLKPKNKYEYLCREEFA